MSFSPSSPSAPCELKPGVCCRLQQAVPPSVFYCAALLQLPLLARNCLFSATLNLCCRCSSAINGLIMIIIVLCCAVSALYDSLVAAVSYVRTSLRWTMNSRYVGDKTRLSLILLIAIRPSTVLRHDARAKDYNNNVQTTTTKTTRSVINKKTAHKDEFYTYKHT